MKAKRTQEQIDIGQIHKRVLSPHIVDQWEFSVVNWWDEDISPITIKYHIIDTSAEALTLAMSPNQRLSAYAAEQFLWMTDAIDKEFRPLIAIIEAFDIPRLQNKLDNVCIGWVQTALKYAKDNEINHTKRFLEQLRICFVHVSKVNKDTEYFVPEIQKAIEYIDTLLADY